MPQKGEPFSEDSVICFPVRHVHRWERVRVRLPHAAVAANVLKTRIDGLPYTNGNFLIKDVELTNGEDAPSLSYKADLAMARHLVRQQVLQSEAEERVWLPHYPESISIELTSKCNLRCPHCSAHGKLDLHRFHNRRPEMSPALLRKIGNEIFPHITTLSLVGRGEPTMTSDELWSTCIQLVKKFDINISCVTNGHFLRKRFTPDVMPYVDELCVSIDGNSETTHRCNRRGSRFADVMANLEYFHEARRSLHLAKRPTLSFYWTLMHNNIHELASFVRDSARFQPDFFALRHLVVFHERDREQSLVGHPQLLNHHLKEVYAELRKHGIRFEGPPLMQDADEGHTLPMFPHAESATPPTECSKSFRTRKSSLFPPRSLGLPDSRNQIERCTWMHRTGIIMSDGEVTTCGKHFGQRVGMLGTTHSFWNIWNGSAMRDLRATFGTDRMWPQCQSCWLRELKWHSQRMAKNNGQVFSDYSKSHFSPLAWDYRHYDLYPKDTRALESVDHHS